MNSSKLWKNILVVTVNMVVLIFAVRWLIANIHFSELTKAFQQVSPMSWVLVAAINLIVLACFAYRLVLLTDIRPRVAFNVASLGAGLNGLLPLRLGDVAGIYYSRSLYRVSATQLVAASFAAKLFDLAALGLTVMAIAFTGSSRLIGAGMVLTLAVMISAGFLILFILSRHAQKIGALVGGSEFLQTVLSSLQHHLLIRRKAAVSITTMAMWLFNLLAVFVGLNLFLPDVEILFLDASVILLIIALAIAVPGAPAGLGIFEAGIVSYLTLAFRITSEKALVAALLLHLAISLPTIFLSLAIILNPRRCD